MNPFLRQIFVLPLICLAAPVAGAFAQNAGDSQPEVEWRIVIKQDTQGTPHSTVDLVINAFQVVRIVKPTETGGFKVLPPSEYADYKVPAKALCACYAWWAGSGTRFYAIGNDKSDRAEIVVYRMDEDEGDTSRHRWRRVRTIKVE